MSVHYITGNAVDNVGSILVQAGSVSSAEITNLASAHVNLKNDGNKAVTSEDQTTIRQSASSGNVVHISVSGEYTALRLGGNPSPGSTVTLVGASAPFSRVYKVLGTSGNYTVTTTPYMNCTGISNSGTFTVSAGSLDSPTQGQVVAIGYTTELGGLTNTAIQKNLGGTDRGVDTFVGYRNHVYTNYWDAVFGGSGYVGPCDVTTTTVTLDADEAASGTPTVIFSLGTEVQAADLTKPDTVGMRDPA